MKRFRIIALLLCLLVLFAACGGSEDPGASGEGGEEVVETIPVDSLAGVWYSEQQGLLLQITADGEYYMYTQATAQSLPVSIDKNAIETELSSGTNRILYAQDGDDLVLLYPESSSVYSRVIPLEQDGADDDVQSGTVGDSSSALDPDTPITQFYHPYDLSANDPEKVYGLWKDQTIGNLMWIRADNTLLSFGAAVESEASSEGKQLTVETQNSSVVYDIEFEGESLTLTSLDKVLNFTKIG